MKTAQPIAEVNIHLRARAQDRMLIDRAAELLGANRSQFMITSAVKEAKNVLPPCISTTRISRKCWTGSMLRRHRNKRRE